MRCLRNKNGKISKAKVTGGVVTAAAIPALAFMTITADVGTPMTGEFEGLVLGNYIDSVGVETWCRGETQVGRMESGYTKEYCETLFRNRFNQYSGSLFTCYDDEMKRFVTPAMHASFVDVYFNTGARCKTGMMRNLKKGDPVAACNFIKEYRKARAPRGSELDTLDGKVDGRMDCSLTKGRANGCYGVWDRRVKSLSMCLPDAEKIPEGGIGAELSK